MHHVHREVFRKHLPPWIAYPLMWCEEKLMPLVYRNTTFVAVSEDTRDEMIARKMSRRRIGLVYNGVDGSLEPGAKAARPTVLYLGRLKNYKRVDVLIRAFADVLRVMPDAQLKIAGDGDALPKLQELASALGITQSVDFEGHVSDDRKRRLLQESWVFVNPSEMEGWGISVLEANACGTPAIAYAVPGLREAIIDGVSGILVAEGGDLAAAVLEVLTDDVLRENLAFGAVARAGAFSWEASARGMLRELMQAIIGSEIKSVDLHEDWSLVAAQSRLAARHYSLSSSTILRPPNLDDLPVSNVTT